jgi:hypothetical protein
MGRLPLCPLDYLSELLRETAMGCKRCGVYNGCLGMAERSRMSDRDWLR